MSNQLAVPAHIAARIAARQTAGTKSAVAAAIVSDGPSIPRISLKASRFRLVEDGVETVVGITLDTVIVGANPHVSKVFYKGQYDSSAEATRPDCFSNDGISPDASIDSPVCSSCAACPNNVLGSKIIATSGAKSKLCADQRHLAIVAAADPSKVYSLTVPVSGMKALREYFKELGNYGIGPEEVITELGFANDVSYPKLTFKQKGYVPERVLPQVDALVASDTAKVATREMPPLNAPALAAPPRATALNAPAPAPVDDAYEEEAAVVATPAPVAKAAPAKPSVTAVRASSELEAKLDSLFDE